MRYCDASGAAYLERDLLMQQTSSDWSWLAFRRNTNRCTRFRSTSCPVSLLRSRRCPTFPLLHRDKNQPSPPRICRMLARLQGPTPRPFAPRMDDRAFHLRATPTPPNPRRRLSFRPCPIEQARWLRPCVAGISRSYLCLYSATRTRDDPIVPVCWPAHARHGIRHRENSVPAERVSAVAVLTGGGASTFTHPKFLRSGR